jgi:hypothetical protein
MDPNELIKAAPEIAKGAGALAAAIPFTSIVKRMLGPAADELAEMWRDQVRMYRYERQLKCVEKAERMAQEAGFTPQAVPPKILFPLLEGASFEEDESLHNMWAALLANAASMENAEKVRPGFIATLKQLSRDEALILEWMYETLDRRNEILDAPFMGGDLVGAYAAIGYGEVSEWNPDNTPKAAKIQELDLQRCLDGLQAAQLIRLRYDLRNPMEPFITPEMQPYSLMGTQYYSMTARGFHFVTACHPPKPK